MQQSDSKSSLTPYQLATLASRICPERCMTEPKEAIVSAERLLQEAAAAIDRARHEAWEAERAREIARQKAKPSNKWVPGVKLITKQKRKDRAIRSFIECMKDEGLNVDEYKRGGFSDEDLLGFQCVFEDWRNKQNRKKGKQGRRISEHDGRLRTELSGLVPRKPRKSA